MPARCTAATFGALALAAEGDLLAGEDLFARAELAALKSHLELLLGLLRRRAGGGGAGRGARRRLGDELLRVFARRMGCVVFGNMAVASWPERLQALLDMTIVAGEPWEEAMSRNDLAHLRMEQGDVAEDEAELARAEAVASRTNAKPSRWR